MFQATFVRICQNLVVCLFVFVYCGCCCLHGSRPETEEEEEEEEEVEEEEEEEEEEKVPTVPTFLTCSQWLNYRGTREVRSDISM